MRKLLALFLLIAGTAHAANIESNVYSATGGTGNALLTNSAVQVGPVGQRNLNAVLAYNPNGSVEYLQFFDAAATSVALGTTVPKMVVPIGSTSSLIVPLSNTGAVTFYTGLSAAATTTATGGSAPGMGITAQIVFQ